MKCKNDKIDNIVQSKYGSLILFGIIVLLTGIFTTAFYVETASLIVQLMVYFTYIILFTRGNLSPTNIVTTPLYI